MHEGKARTLVTAGRIGRSAHLLIGEVGTSSDAVQAISLARDCSSDLADGPPCETITEADAILELVEEGWSIVQPYPGPRPVNSDREAVYGYGLTRTIH